MDFERLSRISFKHLTVLHVMLDTYSVTKTAQILSVTPSSVSKILSQLKQGLSDELFLRDSGQLLPTSYALKIAPTVNSMLANMNQLLTEEAFQPAHFDGKFAFSMRQSTFEIFAKPLGKLTVDAAPNAKLQVTTKARYGFQALHSGLIDFILLPHDVTQTPSHNKELSWEPIIEDERVCLMRPEHPLANSTLSQQDYLQASHVDVLDSELSESLFEKILKQYEHERNTKISVSDYGCAALLCQHSDIVLTCSKAWADVSLQAQGLVQKTLPFAGNKLAYSLVWNRFNTNAHTISWLVNYLRSRD
ncbi:LysR family transcriptional regulator [Vibrio hippocampi]|uniref:PCP degradation transcriptional activation protein n=1 Tax=Vibrio hippocampi TaxID=654686 RepID=A0ABM8ZKU5_9VIBR|nr:LysR family transcriptional regulator [Vibrio hippocampi]CAH0528882.1 PCP degradation transcriptional activation protein [Vibrio hippocampi]